MDGSKSTGASGGSIERAGLRERKAASTRLAIARVLSQRLATTALGDIRVEDVADEANVSRMTFFNYFPTKDHALDLVLAIWMFELQADVERRGLTGVAAIERIFARLGDFVAENPERMRRFVAALIARPSDRGFAPLGPLERAELAPDLAGRDIEPLSLGAMLMGAVEHARRAAEIAIEGTPYELAHYLGALANGAAMVGHSSAAETDWRRLFRRHVRRALGIPLDGAETAATPKTPERWKKKKPTKPTTTKAPKTAKSTAISRKTKTAKNAGRSGR